ncbi:programmed cell death protein 2-like [Hylaeus anthracinus]|uniref:programmed cell death protein 2-like n=1 Tax=Hylaeus volcanicus TaxID=313075 RepID=UPI0023B7E2BD|nr:programmed cell death protein 2-like [Hylaeus volcanicus]XP_054003762.1 programmed cell death protein 2-like [Hylaeus anthracinus]
MACDNRTKVYLGYEDEYVTDKHRSSINFMTNKIGGFPNCHEKTTLSLPQCRLCGLHQLLALQLYVPLDNSKYHRTLYIFACINPNCWNQNESWTCIRVQVLEDECKTNALDSSSVNVPSTTSWLSDADDWGDNLNDNSEKNGNNLLSNNAIKLNFSLRREIDENIREELSVLHVDDPNANSPASVESPVGIGAVGRLDSPQASAEIDGEESEVVCIDTPTQPQCDLISLLHDVTPFPIQLESNTETKFSFVEIFLSVEEEDRGTDVPQHVCDLLLEYQYRNPDLSTKSVADLDESKTTETATEKYEKSIPMHGDEMFHNFVSQIQKNPGQLLRYSRDNSMPLLLYPISGCVGRCRHCGSEMTFELQILPTLISKLILQPRTEKNFQIEFGTVLVYTCARSCWSATDLYREEHVIVQAERL